MLKDLIRFAVLPPENNWPDSNAARYLLHAYQGPSKKHLAEKKNSRGGAVGFTRSWVKKIRHAGIQEISTIHASDEVSQFDGVIGRGLRDLELTGRVSNLVYEPQIGKDDVYFCYLTRLDDFTVKLGSEWFARRGGVLSESAPDAFSRIQSAVVAGLAL